MLNPITIIIIEKTGIISTINIKDFDENNLFKKCGFKKQDEFKKQVDWKIKKDKQKYNIAVYAKADGKPNNENKYDFPPPIDNQIFFGSCAIVASIVDDTKTMRFTNLSLELWQFFYEKLFGGFEDLSATQHEDEEEEDELLNIPKNKITKDGYLKDGFVIDSNDDENAEDDELSAYYGSEDDDSDSDSTDCISLQDIGSELSEDNYDYENKG
jgi:hypothetical protein